MYSNYRLNLKTLALMKYVEEDNCMCPCIYLHIYLFKLICIYAFVYTSGYMSQTRLIIY